VPCIPKLIVKKNISIIYNNEPVGEHGCGVPMVERKVGENWNVLV
jgi:hypothetical protein